MRFSPIFCALVALAGCDSPTRQQASNGNEALSDAGPHKGVDRSHRGQPGPGVSFKDPDGSDITLAEFRGKPLLVNLWASWCAPCVKELPTLDRLSQTNPALEVVAISQDSGPHPSVVSFLGSHQAGHLDAFQDASMAMSGAMGVEVMPTSVLYDVKGREVWRYVGDLNWTSAAAAKLLAEGGVGSAG
ncbi:MAG: TlpA disulfide reductase family protein [Sphingomicrobium sp.]